MKAIFAAHVYLGIAHFNYVDLPARQAQNQFVWQKATQLTQFLCY